MDEIGSDQARWLTAALYLHVSSSPASRWRSAVAAAQDASIAGEVKKIDEGAAKITLKHGPAKSVGMDEGMTMVYRVKDPAMLKQVKVGDKMKFEAEYAASGYTVTKLQKSKSESADHRAGWAPAANWPGG